MTKVSTSKRSVNGQHFVGPVSYSRVRKAFERGAIRVQRDHGVRALKAAHIGRMLKGAQLVFHAVMWQGQERLIDGYTRCERIELGLTIAPEAVTLIVYEEPESFEALIALYDQFDSSASLKKAKDRYDEGMRLNDMLKTMMSPLVIKGQRTAAKTATGAPSVREGVVRAKRGMQFVDSLMLSRTNETLGLLAAYYAISMHADVFDEKCADFIRKMNQRKFSPKAPTDADIALMLARDFHETKVLAGSATGGKNVAAIRDSVLTAFVDYAGFKKLIPAGTTMLTLAGFNMVMTEARKLAA